MDDTYHHGLNIIKPNSYHFFLFEKVPYNRIAWTTVLVLIWLELYQSELKYAWELIADKAFKWLAENLQDRSVDALLGQAKSLFNGIM